MRLNLYISRLHIKDALADRGEEVLAGSGACGGASGDIGMLMREREKVWN